MPQRSSAPRTPLIFWVLLGLFLCLRIFYIYRARIDSDEPQHLHVAWGWTQGLLQYRDLFDNHTPLFHLLLAPLVKIAGERPDIIIAMRWAMIPFFLFSLWCIYRLGRALYSHGVGLWAAAVAAFSPKFFLVAGQFRSDDLWLVLWLASLVVIAEGRWSPKRGFFAGLLLGAAITVSLKTVILLLALSGSLGFVVVLQKVDGKISGANLSRYMATTAVGILIPPLLLLGFYFSKHALPELFYGTVFHNYVPKLGRWKNSYLKLFFLPEIVALAVFGRWIWKTSPSRALAERRTAILLAGGLYLALLVSFWPLLAPESFLPFYPIGSLFVAAWIITAPPLAQRSQRAGAILLGVVTIETLVILCLAPLWHDGTTAEAALLKDVLRLTRLEDYVMDGKGETVFRRRPYYPIFEHITRNRIRQHLTKDSMVEDLIRTQTCVVTSFHPFTRADMTFIKRNYLPVGPLSVAGQLLGPAADTSGILFYVEIPAIYRIIGPDEEGAGELDGTPYLGSRFLDRGEHIFAETGRPGRLAVVWARAIECGYSPFHAAAWSTPVNY